MILILLNIYSIIKLINYICISGLPGLKPTIDIIKFTKKIAIANKESIICGWNLLNKELIKNKTEFIPVDSEHFSIWSNIRNIDKDLIEEVVLTASGGPFLKKSNAFIKKWLKVLNILIGKWVKKFQ